MAGSGNRHIVMLPFMAHGHLISFLALARKIQQRTNLTITIATTSLNIQYLQNAIISTSISSSNDNDIHLVELPLTSNQHGLLPNMDKQGRNISFTTFGAYGTLAYISIWSNLPPRKTDSDEFCVAGFPQNYRFHLSMMHRVVKAADGNDVWSRFFIPQFSLSMKSDGWICNTVEEIEPLGSQLLRKYLELAVWNVGPLMLLPHALIKDSKQYAGKELGITHEACFDWLNLKDESSVLYVTFGSQYSISASQMMALAEGLEESGKPFIWVIKPPFGFDINGEFKAEWLPKGFEERIRENKQGLLVHKWGPQLEILSHKSTGVFLSHCGWNSVLESLSYGVPMIGWPLAAEQGYNVKMLVEEIGVCVELTRTVESVVSWEEIAVHMRMAMTENSEGKGSSVKAMDDFLASVLSCN
ncbi:UDP-glycosyltransferase family, conserved site [Sesbania bispinosa]|nr:UDP-glycosyltransferase family, conserved site [Sesbania bispinosa]